NFVLPHAPVAGPGPARVPGIALPEAPAIPPIPNVIVQRYEPSLAQQQYRAYSADVNVKKTETKDVVVGKLDEVLARLERLESKSLEKLQDEVARLRKELDELRSKE